MSKFECTCGNIISDVQCPNEITGWLLSDKSGVAFFNAIPTIIEDYLQHAATGDVDGWRKKHFNLEYPHDVPVGHMIHDALTARLFELTLATMECDQCGRLWIQRKPDLNHYQGYSPDDEPSQRQKMLGYNDAGLESSTG